MLNLDFLPASPERFIERFWLDEDGIVYSARGAGRKGAIVTEKSGEEATRRYCEHYELVTRQLKWTLRLLALTIVIVLVSARKDFDIGAIVVLLTLILFIFIVIIGMNLRIAVFRYSLTKQLLQGRLHPGLSRKERIQRGFAFGVGALLSLIGLTALFAVASFVLHLLVQWFVPRGLWWSVPAIFGVIVVAKRFFYGDKSATYF